MSDMESYQSIKERASGYYEEKKSRFISNAFPIQDDTDIQGIIKEIKKKNPDARHHCWAYVLKNGNMRYSDDSEPQGTAGIPILETIKSKSLTDVLVVVTRFFGGVLLGASGLARAYASSAKDALDKSHIVKYESFAQISFTCSYADFGKYQAIICTQDTKVLQKEFNSEVKIVLVIKERLLENYQRKIYETTNGKMSPICLSKYMDYE